MVLLVFRFMSRFFNVCDMNWILLQTWQLWEQGRLLEILDPELLEYPEEEVIRFIKVALLCTQAVAQKRPDMKQVVKMLSKDVVLKDHLLTEPGIYRPHSSNQSDRRNFQFTRMKKNKLSETTLSSQLDITHSDTEMIPR